MKTNHSATIANATHITTYVDDHGTAYDLYYNGEEAVGYYVEHNSGEIHLALVGSLEHVLDLVECVNLVS